MILLVLLVVLKRPARRQLRYCHEPDSRVCYCNRDATINARPPNFQLTCRSLGTYRRHTKRNDGLVPDVSQDPLLASTHALRSEELAGFARFLFPDWGHMSDPVHPSSQIALSITGISAS